MSAAPPSGTLDFDEVRAQLAVVSHFLLAHGGAIELDSVEDGGVVRVRFEGLCASCALRPITLEALVRPSLLALDGVEAVEVSGLRISDEAGARLAAVAAAEREASGSDSQAP